MMGKKTGQGFSEILDVQARQDKKKKKVVFLDHFSV